MPKRTDLQADVLAEPTGVSAGYWRSWSENAPDELLEAFQKRSGKCIKDVRSRFPARTAPGTDDYSDMRRECVDALNQLAQTIQGEHDADD